MKTLYTIILFSCIAGLSITAQNTWTQKSDFMSTYGQPTRGQAVGFVISDTGYIGTGCYGNAIFDFSKYNSITDTWAGIPYFTGSSRYECVSFTINGKSYCGLGESSGGNTAYQDWWMYNPTTNTWTQKANFGGGPRYAAVGFSIGGKGYIGTGDSLGHVGGGFNDFWEYDPIADTWTKKANMPGAARYDAVGFSINGKGYIGTGWTNTVVNDFWEYTPSTNSWVQKANYGGGQVSQAVGFSIGNYGYIGTGYPSNTNFYAYNQLTDTWTQKASFPGTPVRNAVGFSIGNKGYIGTGDDGSGTSSNIYSAFYQYDSGINLGIDNQELTATIALFPNPAISMFTITTEGVQINEIKLINVLGEEILKRSEINNTESTININSLPKGIYIVEVITDKGKIEKKLIKN